jgi:hypothetical protein
MSPDAQIGSGSRRGSVVWAVVFAAGLAAWFVFGLNREPDRAWRALLVNFLYFSGLASGLAVWPAIVIASRGCWMGPIERTALAGASFAPVSLAAFGALWLGRAHWVGWLKYEDLSNAAWLNEPLLFARDAVALMVLWAMAWWFARSLGRPRQKVRGAWLAFVFCVAWTLLAFDLVMAQDPAWISTLFGAYFFISSLYIAVAAWTFLALLKHPPEERGSRQEDLGKLIVAFSLMTTYLMFSQLLPIWYENIPHEARFVLPRLRLAPWKWISAALLPVVYLGPLVLLLTRRSKRTSWHLGVVSLAVLAGMWIERWWLVTPTLGGRPVLGLTELSITAAFVGALALAMSRYRAPAARLEDTKP